MQFSSGARPTRAEIHALAEQLPDVFVSHDPGAPIISTNADGSHAWLELLTQGMTFDLSGLAEGAPHRHPDVRHHFGVQPDRGSDSEQAQALLLEPGPHLQASILPVPLARTMMGMTRELAAHLEGVEAIIWEPSGAAMGVDYFTRIVDDWIAGGAFPALGLVSYEADRDGGLASSGLASFTGQEFVLVPELAGDRQASLRIAVRLAHEMVALGSLQSGQTFIAPGGELLRADVTEDGALVRIEKG